MLHPHQRADQALRSAKVSMRVGLAIGAAVFLERQSPSIMPGKLTGDLARPGERLQAGDLHWIVADTLEDDDHYFVEHIRQAEKRCDPNAKL